MYSEFTGPKKLRGKVYVYDKEKKESGSIFVSFLSLSLSVFVAGDKKSMWRVGEVVFFLLSERE